MEDQWAPPILGAKLITWSYADGVATLRFDNGWVAIFEGGQFIFDNVSEDATQNENK